MRKSVLVALSAVLLLSACTAIPGAPPAATPAAGAPTVTVDPPPTSTVAVGQPFQLVVHAQDAVGVARIELRVNDIAVAQHTSPNPTGEPRLDALLSWTPPTPGAAAVVVTAYRADGTASAPAVLAVEVVAPGTSVVVSPDASASAAAETGAPSPGESVEPGPGEPTTAPPPSGGGATPTKRPRPRPTRAPATAAQGPDLVISSIDVYNSTGPDVKSAYVLVANDGNAPSGPSEATVGYSGQNSAGGFKAEPIPALGPGDSYQFIRTTEKLAPGTYTFSATADVNRQVSETDEENNGRSVEEEVEAPPPPQGDLQLTPLSFPQTMTVGQEAKGAFYVKNVGPADITTPFGVGWGYGGPSGGGAGSKLIEGLAAGQQRFVSVAITPNAPGPYTINLFADSGEAIAESDEGNNKASYTVSAQ